MTKTERAEWDAMRAVEKAAKRCRATSRMEHGSNVERRFRAHQAAWRDLCDRLDDLDAARKLAGRDA